MRKLLTVLLITFLLTACDEIQGLVDIEENVKTRMKDPGKKLQALRNTAQKIFKDPQFSTYFNSCPAADFGKKRSSMTLIVNTLVGIDEMDMAFCQVAPEVCMLQCTTGNGEACLELARAFESVRDKIGKVPGRMAFALACATGSSSGCTNRGAGMRNAPISGDPMSMLPDEEKYACTFSLFSTACTKNDPWGCSMLGEAYAEGEGTPVDLNLARKHFRAACELAPEDDSCNYAKQLQVRFEKNGD